MSKGKLISRAGFLPKGFPLFLFPLILLSFFSACDQPLPYLIHDPVSPIPSSTEPTQSTGKAPLRSTSTPSTKASPSPSSSIAAPSPTITIGVKEDELKGQVLHFWHPWTGPTKKAIDNLVEEFNLENPWGILVTAVAFPGYDQLAEKMGTNLKTPDSPQVVAGLLHQALIWDRAKPLVDLQTYIFDQNWGFKPDEQANFYTLFWEQNIVGGKRLGIPAYQTGQFIYYNQTWAKELGFQTPPITTEQFQQQACAAAKANKDDDNADNKGTGGLIVSTDPGVMLGWIEAFGGSPTVTEDGSRTSSGDKVTKTSQPAAAQSAYHFNTPETEKAFVFLRKMYDDGCAWQSQNQTSEEPFARRLGLFATGSVTDVPYQARAFASTGSNDQWSIIPFPSPSSEPAIVITGPSYFLLPGSPQQQLAGWLFIRWLSAADKNARLIEANGALPVRSDVIADMGEYEDKYPQWSAAIGLIKYMRREPAYASWGKVRRALGDAAIQLYRSYFTTDQIPATLKYLDTFAAELHLGPDFGKIFTTPTPTLKPGIRPTRTPISSTPTQP